MAIIKFINNKVGLKKTLNYVCKEEKTNNKFISGKDCMAENAYEEMIAIKNACKKLNTWHLDDCELYVTMEPCMMCAGALIQSRIKKIIYGVNNEKFGHIESIEKLLSNKNLNHKVIVVSKICENEIRNMLKSFFIDKRK